MGRFLTGVLLSECLALWVEGAYKFGVHSAPKSFAIAIPLYFLYLCALHGLLQIAQKRKAFWLIGIAIGGITGLALEWFVVGNSPWNQPQVFQTGQFLFHGAYPILGYLLARTPAPTHLKHQLVWYMSAATVLLLMGLLFRHPHASKLWFLFVPLIVFAGLYSFIYRLGTVAPSLRQAQQTSCESPVS